MVSNTEPTGARRTNANAQAERKKTVQNDVTPKTPLLLTPRQAAEALSISPRKLWSMTNTREVPSIRLGRCVRYPADQLKRWIDSQIEDGARRLPPNG